MTTKLARTLLWLLLAVFVTPAYADEMQDLENLRSTTLNLIRLLVREGILTQDKADALIKEAEKRTPPSPGVAAAPGTIKSVANAESKPVVRVPYVPETVKQEIREQIKQEVLAQAKTERWGDPGSVPEWIDRITLDGDLRLRLQKDIFQSDNVPAINLQAINGTNIVNTTDDRERLRARARLGVQAKVTDWLSAGMRITTGSGTDPLSTNQTLGNTFNKYSVFLDRAYLRAEPWEWLTVSGGRIPNPFFGTDLVWNENLNFEGAAASIVPKFGDTLSGFMTVGAFPLQEIEPSQAPVTRASSKWLYGAQLGFEARAIDSTALKLGVGFYDYRKVEGISNPDATSTVYDLTVPQFRQKGNSLFQIGGATVNPLTGATPYALASKFKNLNLTGALDLARFDPLHIILSADYVKNMGFDSGEIFNRTGQTIKARTTGYQAKVTFGVPRLQKRHDWQAYFSYKYLERDAVLDAFTDSDFHLGGTDAKGYVIGANYGLDKNAWLAVRWMSSTQIDGLPLAIDVLQLDFNARF
jgi:hypothetical protein